MQATLRNNLKNNFTIVANEVCEDTLISMKALGLYVYIASKPDGWVFYLEQLAHRFGCGKDAIRSALGELEKAKRVERFKERNKQGQFVYFYSIG